jgi:hypothetical protein
MDSLKVNILVRNRSSLISQNTKEMDFQREKMISTVSMVQYRNDCKAREILKRLESKSSLKPRRMINSYQFHPKSKKTRTILGKTLRINLLNGKRIR